MAEAAGLWDEARTAELRRLWEEGRSAGQIAASLSTPGRLITRNTICGKLHRMGLKGRPTLPEAVPHGPRTADAPQEPPRPVPSPPTLAAVARVAQDPARISIPGPVQKPGAAGEAVTIQELAADMCRWPLGDPSKPTFRYCGSASLLGRPYCGHHAMMAYEPARQRTAR